MHSSRMCTARLLTLSCSIPCIGRGVCPTCPGCRLPLDADPAGCRPFPPPIGGRPPWSCDLWYTLGREPPSPVGRQTPVKILPCPKLRLRVVIKGVVLTNKSRYNWRISENISTERDAGCVADAPGWVLAGIPGSQLVVLRHCFTAENGRGAFERFRDAAALYNVPHIPPHDKRTFIFDVFCFVLHSDSLTLRDFVFQFSKIWNEEWKGNNLSTKDRKKQESIAVDAYRPLF